MEKIPTFNPSDLTLAIKSTAQRVPRSSASAASTSAPSLIPQVTAT
jgi:hypothetical protein